MATNDTTVYVAVSPKRQGMSKEPPIVGAVLENVIEEATKEYDLPYSASKLSSWEQQSKWGGSNVWRYKHPHDPPNKYYVYEREPIE